MAQLKRLLGGSGSIVAYNMEFEIGRLRECAEVLPEYQDWYQAVRARLIDLLDVFDSLDYYHPAQKGSASLKAVLPTITDTSYAGFEISDGDTASREFMRVTFGNVQAEERLRVRQQLQAYCRQDTQALIDIVYALQKL